ncbi:hypothetical protein E2C01_059416 [Portunus trituberculatus]|uniref:Uncharacterized protein n=1 Tax=Portunus trituberculatus TaxID=210409 RepID=A0A5B7H5A7_PORTR|nr:hypothetical protein [Portunus trituberculatus]
MSNNNFINLSPVSTSTLLSIHKLNCQHQQSVQQFPTVIVRVKKKKKKKKKKKLSNLSTP